jgi:hypothetical protein
MLIAQISDPHLTAGNHVDHEAAAGQTCGF